MWIGCFENYTVLVCLCELTGRQEARDDWRALIGRLQGEDWKCCWCLGVFLSRECTVKNRKLRPYLTCTDFMPIRNPAIGLLSILQGWWPPHSNYVSQTGRRADWEAWHGLMLILMPCNTWRLDREVHSCVVWQNSTLLVQSPFPCSVPW